MNWLIPVSHRYKITSTVNQYRYCPTTYSTILFDMYALFHLIGLLPADELVDMSDLLSVTPVSPALLTECTRSNTALDEYLTHRLLSTQHQLTQPALQALTEIFHSCFISEQRVVTTSERQDSAQVRLLPCVLQIYEQTKFYSNFREF